MNPQQLPDGLTFTTLNLSYLSEIHLLLSHHYGHINDNLRIVYSRDYLYWYLKYIPHGFIVGLIYQKKLIGVATATFIDMTIYNTNLKLPYINLLCVQLQNDKLKSLLLDEIHARIDKLGFKSTLYVDDYKTDISTTTLAVPINYKNLKEVEFLEDDLEALPAVANNPLHLVTKEDLPMITVKLNKFLERYHIHPVFMEASAAHFLLPKKNIIYAFVKRTGDVVTDFISVHKYYIHCVEKNKMITVAHLMFYFYETVTLTELVGLLLDKLSQYRIDQLEFRQFMDNDTINVTKFVTYGQLFYHFRGLDIRKISNDEFCVVAI